MKKYALLAGLALLARVVFAQQASVVYVQGSVDLQPAGQQRAPAQIGQGLNVGDSIITGGDGSAQLQKQDTTEINVAPDTVFTLRRHAGSGGQTQDVLSVALGSITFSFNQLTGNEPDIATASATAGIRGTVVTVYAGADGSSLFVVKKGRVVVQSGGKTAVITKDEGVEVTPGQPPGQKFTALHGVVDYSTWNKQRLNNLLLDPAGAALRIQAQMNSYIDEIHKIAPEYNKTYAELTRARDERDAIGKKLGKAAMHEFAQEHVIPLEQEANLQFVNLRYYALSALSLKAYVLGRMYIWLTSTYITDQSNPVYRKFMEIYDETARSFELEVTPLLVPADI